ncbi:unnamed protein product [Toxocara canis]|uniref:Transposase n=1 Tax=Toxocara canis TaxID=6265 RepID=A0A183TW86_TOXCA|nr:unnamed protein product [Toxocara canis]
MERRMVGVRRLQHIVIEDLSSRYGAKDVVEEMYKRKQRWGGHVARMKGNRWTKRMVEWYPRDVKRPRRRPPARREDPLRRVCGVPWMRRAHEGDRWKICQLHG